jgi:hypothetical protein
MLPITKAGNAARLRAQACSGITAAGWHKVKGISNLQPGNFATALQERKQWY